MLNNTIYHARDEGRHIDPGCRGFTLVELIITLVVAMILATVAVPSFFGLIQNNRISSESNKLLSSLLLTRSEAIKRQYDVVLCPSADGSACSSDWSQSNWLIFVDNDDDGVAGEATDGNGDIDAGETLLRLEPVDGSTMSWGVVTGADTVTFSANGMADGVHKLRLVDSRGERRCIEILSSGRPVVTADGDCPAPSG